MIQEIENVGECSELARDIWRTIPGYEALTWEQCRAYVKATMPDETETIKDNVAEELWLMSRSQWLQKLSWGKKENEIPIT